MRARNLAAAAAAGRRRLALAVRTAATAAALGGAAGGAATAHSDDVAASCADPGAACGALVAPACLQSVGAGALPAGSAVVGAPPGCDQQIEAYRGCLEDVATRCGGPSADPHGEDALAALATQPQVTPMMATECYQPVFRQAMCRGAPAYLRVMVADLASQPDFFRDASLELVAVEAGRAVPLADLTPSIDKAAVQTAEAGTPLDAAPPLAAFCLGFTAAGERRAQLQIFRAASMVPAEAARQMGQRLFELKPVSAVEPYDPAAESCAAAVARVATARGL